MAAETLESCTSFACIEPLDEYNVTLLSEACNLGDLDLKIDPRCEEARE